MRTGVYVCLLAAACAAQPATLEGDLVGRGVDLSRLNVRLLNNHHDSLDQANVTVGGSFRFSHVPAGSYTLVVTDQTGNEITRQAVDVMPLNPEIRVQLPEDPAAQRPGGTVSVAHLRHTPDRRAVKDWMAARKLSDAGDYSAAAALLERAIARDPQFAEAHSNLGAEYVRLEEAARAVPEFERAVALDPANALHQSNLAMAMAMSGKLDDAARWARRSLEVDSTNALGHYVLGCLLANDPKTRADGIRHLEIAGRTIPPAKELVEILKRTP